MIEERKIERKTEFGMHSRTIYSNLVLSLMSFNSAIAHT